MEITSDNIKQVIELLDNAPVVLAEARKNWGLYTVAEKKTLITFFDSINELAKGFEA